MLLALALRAQTRDPRTDYRTRQVCPCSRRGAVVSTRGDALPRSGLPRNDTALPLRGEREVAAEAAAACVETSPVNEVYCGWPGSGA